VINGNAFNAEEKTFPFMFTIKNIIKVGILGKPILGVLKLYAVYAMKLKKTMVFWKFKAFGMEITYIPNTYLNVDFTKNIKSKSPVFRFGRSIIVLMPWHGTQGYCL